jgi:hypothetical protein
MMDARMRNLSCKRLEMDEIWGFVGQRDRNVKKGDSMEVGSVWTFCAIVEVFDLKGHPKTHTAYAWSHDTDDPDNPRRHVTVLHIDPALSPLEAVRAAIIQEFRNAEPA